MTTETRRRGDLGGLPRRLLARIVLWAIGDRIETLDRQMQAKIDAAQEKVLSRVTDRIAALGAMDVRFQETGKVILIARVSGQDRVQIIDIPALSTVVEMRRLGRELEDRYGAKTLYFDTPPGYSGEMFA